MNLQELQELQELQKIQRIRRIRKRRDFLKKSLALGVFSWTGGLFSPLPAASGKPGSSMRLGLVTYMWGAKWDLPTIIKNLEASRVLGVELRTTHKHGVEITLNARERREVRKRFESSPVVLVGLGSNERFDHPDPGKLKQAIETTKAFVKLSHDVGGSGVKVKPNSFHKGVDRRKTIEQIGKSLNLLGRFAADYKQQIRLEVHGQCSPLPVIKEIMDIATHPNVAVCWNSNMQDLQGKGLEYNFNLVKRRFGATAHIRPLDFGNYPWQRLIDLFVGMDYKGWLLLECTNKVDDYVKELIRQRELLRKMTAAARAHLGR